jgi:hypothetical protein
VVVEGEPNARLVDLVVSPRDYLRYKCTTLTCILCSNCTLIRQNSHSHQYQLNARYYITRLIIPSIGRIMKLMGVDIRLWFERMPRPKRIHMAALRDMAYEHIKETKSLAPPLPTSNTSSTSLSTTSSSSGRGGWRRSARGARRGGSSKPTSSSSSSSSSNGGMNRWLPLVIQKTTMNHYFKSSHCALCDLLTTTPYCDTCLAQPQWTLLQMMNKLTQLQRDYTNVLQLCSHCTGVPATFVPSLISRSDSPSPRPNIDNDDDCHIIEDHPRSTASTTSSSSSSSVVAPTPWPCHRCTLDNIASATKCAVCDALRPPLPAPPKISLQLSPSSTLIPTREQTTKKSTVRTTNDRTSIRVMPSSRVISMSYARVECDSLDCSLTYVRHRLLDRLNIIDKQLKILYTLLS